MPNRLYLIDGTSGIWKNDLLRYAKNACSNAEVIKKFSTRKPREAEPTLDLIFVTKEHFSEMPLDYVYPYSDESYGVGKARLAELLQKRDAVFFILRNIDLVKRLKVDFALFRPVTVFIHSSYSLISERLGEAAKTQEASIVTAFHDYLRRPDLYDYVVINGGTYDDFCRVMDGVRARCVGEGKETAEQKETPLSLRKMWDNFTRLSLRDQRTILGIIIFILSVVFGTGVFVEKRGWTSWTGPTPISLRKTLP
jgi:guanylate kinase